MLGDGLFVNCEAKWSVPPCPSACSPQLVPSPVLALPAPTRITSLYRNLNAKSAGRALW